MTPYRSLIQLLCLTIPLLCGCSSPDPLSDALEEYVSRLSRVLDQTAPTVEPQEKVSLDARQWHQSLPEMSLNLREFFGLRECTLATLVAERNTVLGKTQLPSQRLFYESQLIDALHACASQIRQRAPDEAARLAEWHEQKLAAWPQQWAQFAEQTDELLQSFTLRTHGFDEQASGGNESVQALHYITARQQHGPWHLNELERHLQTLSQTRFFARLWYSQQQLQQHLEVLNPWLSEHLPAISCPSGKASQKAEILRNVFYLFFIEKIQPVATQLNRYQYAIQPIIAPWLQHPHLHPSYKQWLQQHTQTAFARYQALMKTHVNVWQTFFARCDLSPTGPSATRP